jgi:hypothetical protein
MAKWLRFSGRPALATIQGPATQTEPPQVSGLPVAQIQWQRTDIAGHNETHVGMGESAGMASRSASMIVTYSRGDGVAINYEIAWVTVALQHLRAGDLGRMGLG